MILNQIPIERIEDPTLSQLFREQQLELDRKFTMLIDRGSARFLYGSLQVFGTVEDTLLNLAKELLGQLPRRSRDESKRNSVDANAFALRANRELDYFRKTLPGLGSKVIVREDITGLMVSKGNLLIGACTKIPLARVEALIAHEVGTHEMFEKVNFSNSVIDALERKVEYMSYYNRNFDNDEMATL